MLLKPGFLMVLPGTVTDNLLDFSGDFTDTYFCYSDINSFPLSHGFGLERVVLTEASKDSVI
jgi:hypothetical protein